MAHTQYTHHPNRHAHRSPDTTTTQTQNGATDDRTLPGELTLPFTCESRSPTNVRTIQTATSQSPQTQTTKKPIPHHHQRRRRNRRKPRNRNREPPAKPNGIGESSRRVGIGDQGGHAAEEGGGGERWRVLERSGGGDSRDRVAPFRQGLGHHRCGARGHCRVECGFAHRECRLG